MVDACVECNNLLNAAVFDTMADRVAYLKAALRRRYAKVLRMPDWKREELEELAPAFRRSIVNFLQIKQEVLARLTW